MTDWGRASARIKARRLACGWTQAELAARVGLTANNVAQVEGGLPISEKKLAAFAKALDLSMPFLRYGVVTELDRAAIEASAYARGHAEALEAMRGWIGRAEADARALNADAPRSTERGAEVFTSDRFTQVDDERIAALRASRAAEDAATARKTGTPKKRGGK